MKSAHQPSGRYPIRAVSKLTGISVDTLRAWERRYGAVAPTRDDRGRLYSDADLARLRMLHRAVSAGHSVGRIATLTDEELLRLSPAPPAALTGPSAAGVALDTSRFRAALQTFDSVALDREFSRLATVLPPTDLVQGVLMPVVREVGDEWNAQRGGIAHEHMISSTLRHLLGSFLRVYARGDSSVRLLFTTLSGDRHELGILGAAMLASSRGLAVSYVGPDLPADEIVAAVQLAGAQVLVLGLTLTSDGKARERGLRTLVRSLPQGVELWAGGPGTAQYASVIGARGLALDDFSAYVTELDRIARGR